MQLTHIIAEKEKKSSSYRDNKLETLSDEKKAKMQSIRSDVNSKIEAILNDDQKKQFEQDHQSMQERMQQRGPGGGGPSPQ